MARHALPLTFAVALAAGATAPASSEAARGPAIRAVAPLRVHVGERLTITGTGFLPGAKRTSVIFKVAGRRSVSVRAVTATRRRVVVTVPASVGTLLAVRDGRPVATRVRLRVRAGRLSPAYTPGTRSPLVTPPGPGTPAVAVPDAAPAPAPVPAASAPAPKSVAPTRPATSAPAAAVPTAKAPAPATAPAAGPPARPVACSTTATRWPLDLSAGTFANWPETHLSADSAILDAADPRVPAGAPMPKVAMLVAARDPLGGGDARSAIQQKFSVKPEQWDRFHQHGKLGTAGYYIDPYPAEWLDRDGVAGMERYVRESIAVPAGAHLTPGTIVSDWHAKWGVNIVLRTASDGSGAWELVVRGGRFEFAPKNALGKPVYPAWANKTNAPYWSPYAVPGVGTFAQEYQRVYKAIAPITPGQWETLTWHIVYAADATQGELELSWNGRLIHSAHEPTLFRLIGSTDPDNTDGVKPAYHQIQAYQPGFAPTDPPQRIFAAPDAMANAPLDAC